MMFVDIVLIVIIGAFVLFGLFFGFVHTLGSLIGAIVAILFASRLVDPAFQSFGFLFGGGSAAKVILFIIIFLLVSRLVGLVFWLLGRVWGLLAWIPFASSIDRLLGVLFGFVEGVVVVGIVLYYAMQILPANALRTVLETSFMAKYLMVAVSALQVFFPLAAKQAVESAADSAAKVIPK
jgi:uncharacterized membrane protein required for colicin V production